MTESRPFQSPSRNPDQPEPYVGSHRTPDHSGNLIDGRGALRDAGGREVDYAALMAEAAEQAATEDRIARAAAAGDPAAIKAQAAGGVSLYRGRHRSLAPEESFPQVVLDQLAPVNIEYGQYSLEQVQQAVEFFRDKFLPALIEVGPVTRARLGKLIDVDLAEPDALLITREDAAWSYWRGRDEDQSSLEPVRSRIDVGQQIIIGCATRLKEAADKTQIELSPDQLEQLAYLWVTSHELAHNLQIAYHEAAQRAAASPDNLAAAALSLGLSPGTLKLDLATTQTRMHINHKAETEAFAEGAGQMAAGHWLSTELQLPMPQIHAFLYHLRTAGQAQRHSYFVDKAVKITDQSLPSKTSTPEARSLPELERYGAQLGYARPHTPHQIRRILALTP